MADGSSNAIGAGLVHFARDRPDRRAAWSGERSITFAQLDALAGTLARTLLEHVRVDAAGATPLLPLIVGYDVESVIAIHAAARAGLAHVPIDAGSPPAVVRDLMPRLGRPAVAVITRPEQAALLPEGVVPLLVPADAGAMVEPQPVVGSGLGLVIFTSGSTGRPKGVAMTWDSLLTRNWDLLLDPDEADPAPAALMTPMNYPLGYWRALVPSLGCPASIVEPLALDPVDLLERFDRDRTRVMLLVPSLANSLAARWPAGRRLQHVEELHLFGEPLGWEQVPALRAMIPADADIVFRYGSTEAFTVLHMNVGPALPLGSGMLPLGSPIPGVEVRLEPVDPLDPDGAREIVIRSEPMAIGYLDEPELTAARFGTDPDGRRFCRSGDIGTVDDDGVYHRVGRVDDMVKIRGRLVEPSQPQHVLAAMPGVRNVAVLPQAAADGTPRLIAHIELEPGSTLTPAEIRRDLDEVVAPHLVPQVLVLHDRLPLNEVGKVDRAALMSVDPVPWRSSAPRPPADESERFAMGAAGTVLGLHDVHPDDDLWELGLDSLSAVELTVILEGAGWTDLEPALLMDHRTPAALARLRQDTPEPSEIVWLNAAGTRPPLFCLPGGGGTAMAYRWIAAALGPDQPLMVIEQRGLHSPGRPDRTVEQAAARALAHIQRHLDQHPGPHPSTRTGETETGAHAPTSDGTAPHPGTGGEAGRTAPITIVGYSAGGVVAYETATRMERQHRPVRVVLLDAPGGCASDGRPPPGGSMVIAHGPAQTAKRAALRSWLRVFPASTVPREQRYRAYFLLSGRALIRYAPPPAQFPITFVHPADSTLVDQWSDHAHRLEPVEVTGNHYTMLEPPHAASLARAIQDALA